MYTYIRICMYVYIYVYVCMYVCMYIYKHTHICTCLCVYIYVLERNILQERLGKDCTNDTLSTPL
jgi:hypothetical protein